MRRITRAHALILTLVLAFANPVLAQEAAIGRTVDSLLDYARNNNPEYASMRSEADAAAERITPAGALPDPKFRVELMDITKMGEQNPTLLPNQVGSTKYTVLQELPWYGKRDLKRGIAEMQAEAAQGQLRGAWADIAVQLKTAHAQLYLTNRNEQLTREILDLMVRLEKDAQVRYASGQATQQDVIRSQIEQTGMRNDLIMLENERTMLRARINMLLARPANAPLVDPETLRPIPAPAKLDFATLEERIRARNPQLFTDEARIKSAEKTSELTYKERFPRLHARRNAGPIRKFGQGMAADARIQHSAAAILTPRDGTRIGSHALRRALAQGSDGQSGSLRPRREPVRHRSGAAHRDIS